MGVRSLFFMVALIGLPALCAASEEGQIRAGNPIKKSTLIRSAAELQLYLQTTPATESPLSHLSPPARRRFLDSLMFNETGATGYAFTELRGTLTGEEMREVLGLFGFEPSASLFATALDTSRNHQASPSLLSQAVSPIARAYEKLIATDDATFGLPFAERFNAIDARYRELFARWLKPASIVETNDDDLELLFRAARLAALASGIEEMDRLFDAMRQRDLVQDFHVRDLHSALIVAREFDRVRQLAAEYPSLGFEPLPAFRDGVEAGKDGPSAWTVSPDQRLLTRESVNLDVPARIIIVGHPDCHYSAGAVEDIHADSVLGPAFAQHAQWLAPPSHGLHFDRLQAWNGEHPESPITLAIQRSDWPMIDDWSTPTFYFFKDGELTTKVSGWPLDGAGHRDEVAAALGEIGLLE